MKVLKKIYTTEKAKEEFNSIVELYRSNDSLEKISFKDLFKLYKK